MGKDGPKQTPQVFPFFNLMYPFSPQVADHEFLMVQASSLDPTMNTAWFRAVAQLSKIPDLYKCQLLASTLTAKGVLWMTCSISEHPATSATPKILYFPVGVAQGWFTALQGYSAPTVCPLSLMYSRACIPNPPLHPAFPQGDPVEQSTSCCSLRLIEIGWLWTLTWQDSWAAVAAKAQHDPHWPWFLTAVMTFLFLQSISPANPALTGSSIMLGMALFFSPRQLFMNSSLVRSENWLRPIFQLWVGSALCFSIWMRKFWNRPTRYRNSTQLGVSLPNSRKQFLYCWWREGWAGSRVARKMAPARRATDTKTSLFMKFVISKAGLVGFIVKIRQKRG